MAQPKKNTKEEEAAKPTIASVVERLELAIADHGKANHDEVLAALAQLKEIDGQK